MVQKRWRTLAGFCAVAAVEVATSVWITGIDGVRDYFALARDPAAHFWAATMPCVRGILLDLGLNGAAAWALSAAAVGAYLWWIRRLDYQTTFAAATSIGVFLSFHTMGYDLTLAVIGVVILFDRLWVGWKAAAVVLYLSLIPYFLQKLTSVNGLALAFAVLSAAVALSLREEQAEEEAPKAMAAQGGALA